MLWFAGVVCTFVIRDFGCLGCVRMVAWDCSPAGIVSRGVPCCGCGLWSFVLGFRIGGRFVGATFIWLLGFVSCVMGSALAVGCFRSIWLAALWLVHGLC